MHHVYCIDIKSDLTNEHIVWNRKELIHQTLFLNRRQFATYQTIVHRFEKKIDLTDFVFMIMLSIVVTYVVLRNLKIKDNLL